MLTKDTAICIRVIDYSETSQIATFFAKAAGKISAIAKGSKRPKSAFDGPIEIFSCGRIVFSPVNDGKLATLTEFEQQQTFISLSGNFFVLNCCLFATELLNNLTDDCDSHPELFEYLLQFLQNALDSSGRSGALTLLILFQLALLKEVGLQPVLGYCVNCKTRYGQQAKGNEVYFSSSANGLVCKDCEANFPDKIRLTNTAANCLADLKLIAGAGEKILEEIEKVLIYHFTEIIGRPPKMAKYILKSQS